MAGVKRPLSPGKEDGPSPKVGLLSLTEICGAGKEPPVPPPPPGESVFGSLTYQSEAVPRGLYATGKVKTVRDGSGSDGAYIGCEFTPYKVPVTNGRGRTFTLDDHGFTIVEDKREHIDYRQEETIIKDYYPACCELVKKVTGAHLVVAFDHNVRSKAKAEANSKIEGGSAVQAPALVVHNDYSVTSAPRRVRDLAKPPKVNDTMGRVLGDKPLIDPAEVDSLLAGRWAVINVWRNIKARPVEKWPLAMCEGPSVPLEDVITFEIHYADRIGENYFARHSDSHRWVYFHGATRDEAILLKCWDSAGEAFADKSTVKQTVPATYSFHSAFDDPSSPEDADDRESIEVRTVAFFPRETSRL